MSIFSLMQHFQLNLLFYLYTAYKELTFYLKYSNMFMIELKTAQNALKEMNDYE